MGNDGLSVEHAVKDSEDPMFLLLGTYVDWRAQGKVEEPQEMG